MPKLLLVVLFLPVVMMLQLVDIEQDSQRAVYELVKNSADIAGRSATLQIDWAASSGGQYIIDATAAEAVFMDHFRSNVGLDVNFQSRMFNGPVWVDLTVVNYDPGNPFPRVVSLPNGFSGVISHSSVIAVVTYTRDSLLPGFPAYNARAEVVVQGRFGG